MFSAVWFRHPRGTRNRILLDNSFAPGDSDVDVRGMGAGLCGVVLRPVPRVPRLPRVLRLPRATRVVRAAATPTARYRPITVDVTNYFITYIRHNIGHITIT